jgi:hypothetical protein
LVASIDELFAIDVQAREQNLTVIERDQLRRQKARNHPGINQEPNRNGQRPDSSKERSGQSLQLHVDLLESAISLPGSSDPGAEH